MSELSTLWQPSNETLHHTNPLFNIQITVSPIDTQKLSREQWQDRHKTISTSFVYMHSNILMVVFHFQPVPGLAINRLSPASLPSTPAPQSRKRPTQLQFTPRETPHGDDRVRTAASTCSIANYVDVPCPSHLVPSGSRQRVSFNRWVSQTHRSSRKGTQERSA